MLIEGKKWMKSYSFLTLLLINMRMSVMDLKIIQKKIIKSFARINLVIYIFGRLKSYPCKSCPYKMKKQLPVKLNWLQSIRIFDSCCLRLICMCIFYTVLWEWKSISFNTGSNDVCLVFVKIYRMMIKGLVFQ